MVNGTTVAAQFLMTKSTQNQAHAALIIGALCLTASCSGCGANQTPTPTTVATARVSQIDIVASPTTIALQADKPITIALGIHAVDKLVAPALAGKKLANALLPGASLEFESDGTAWFSYSDEFDGDYRGPPRFGVPMQEDPQTDVEDLLVLPPQAAKPKFMTDAYRYEADFLRFLGEMDDLWITGEIVYKLDFGMPVRALTLGSRDGQHKTSIGAWGGRKIQIAASADDQQWTDMWESSGDHDVLSVDASLPKTLVGSTTIYLRVRALGENPLHALHLSAELDATALLPALKIAQGASTLQYTDAETSSHQAIIYWDDAAVRLGQTTAHDYPSAAPEVNESKSAIVVSFPNKSSISFRRDADGNVTGVSSLVVDQAEVLSLPDVAIAPPRIDILDDGTVGGVADWPNYLAERKTLGKWPAKGQRKRRSLSAAGAYLETKISGSVVTLHTRVKDGDKTASLEWIVEPASKTIAGRAYQGLSYRIRISELPGAERIHLIEPVRVWWQDRTFWQTWGRFYENDLDFTVPFQVGKKWLFGDAQPLLFTAGSRGSTVSFFDKPVGARGSRSSDAGRLLNRLELPLTTGSIRETPRKQWLFAAGSFDSKWAAIDEWTRAYDAVGDHYRTATGLPAPTPVPTVWAAFAPEEVLQSYLTQGPPKLEQSWAYKFAHDELVRIANNGFKLVHFDQHWDTDAVHAESEKLPGAESGFSGNAPWKLDVNAAIGGEKGMREIADQAAKLGVTVIMWIPPAHLSNSSTLLRDNPGWLKWRINGTPEDAGYGDISGTSLNGGWFDYATDRFAKVAAATKFQGVNIDSWLTFAMYADFSEAQPIPQLDRAIELQTKLHAAGLSNIVIEGCGPFGISSGAYAGEAYKHGPPEAKAMVKAIFDRQEHHEYGHYRYLVDTIPEPDSYYRTLASKGALALWTIKDLETAEAATRSRIVQANRDFNRVSDKMKRRRLLASGDTWQGVEWRSDKPKQVVVFAFESFSYQLDGPASVEDLTAGSKATQTKLETKPMHTYLIELQ